MSIAYDLDAIAEKIKETAVLLYSTTNADGVDLEPLRDAAAELEEIAEKLRH